MFGEKKKENKSTGPVLLTTARDDCELGIIRCLLEENQVPFLTRDRESGNYMRILVGSNIFGTDILVNQEDFEKASELLNGISAAADEEPDE